MDFYVFIIILILVISVIIYIVYTSNNKTQKRKNDVSNISKKSRREEADDIARIMTNIINTDGIKASFEEYYKTYKLNQFNNTIQNLIKSEMENNLNGIQFCDNIINNLKIISKKQDTGLYFKVKTNISNTKDCRSLGDNENSQIFHLSIHRGKRPNTDDQAEIHLKINGFDNNTESWDLNRGYNNDYRFIYYKKN